MERDSVLFTIGKIRFLYELTIEVAHELAVHFKAKINKKCFPDCKSEVYSQESCSEIYDSLCDSGNDISIVPNPVHPIFSNRDADISIFRLAIGTDRIDRLIEYARRESQDTRYPVPRPSYEEGDALNVSRRTEFYCDLPGFGHKHFFPEIIQLIILDTCEVDIVQANLYFKEKGFSPCTRQRFTMHSNMGIEWDAFQKSLKRNNALPRKEGGSNQETTKKKATRDACKHYIENHVIDKIPEHSLGCDNFVEEVKNMMRQQGTYKSFQVSEAKSVFYNDPALVPYKRRRGRPGRPGA